MTSQSTAAEVLNAVHHRNGTVELLTNTTPARLITTHQVRPSAGPLGPARDVESLGYTLVGEHAGECELPNGGLVFLVTRT